MHNKYDKNNIVYNKDSESIDQTHFDKKSIKRKFSK